MWTVLLSLVAVQAYQETHQAILSLGDRPDKAGFHYSKTVEVHLTGQPQYAADDPINVNVELYNPGPGAVKILSYFLPAAGSVLDKLFEVTLDGAEVDYIGPTGMRSTPTDADYIKLKKKQSASASFDLAEYFDFSRTGTYTITYDVASWQLFDENGATQKIEAIASDPLVASIEGRPPSPDALGVPDEKKAKLLLEAKQTAGVKGFVAPVYDAQCGSTKQGKIEDAMSMALNNLPASLGARYLGGGCPSFYSAVKSVLQNTRLSYFCPGSGLQCTGNTIAYVYPSNPWNIYLCTLFFGYATNQRAGVVIHELSHFPSVAGTQDYTYGRANSANLPFNYNCWNADNVRLNVFDVELTA